MMKKILVLALSVVVFSCSKKQDDAFVLSFQNLQNKYLVCDSEKTIFNGAANVQRIGKGKGFDLRFLDNGTVTAYTTPQSSFNYYIQSPNKLIYYVEGKDTAFAVDVPLVTTTKLVLQTYDSLGKTYQKFYTPE